MEPKGTYFMKLDHKNDYHDLGNQWNKQIYEYLYKLDAGRTEI